MSNPESWYIVKRPSGHCEVVLNGNESQDQENNSEIVQQWGPFTSQSDAIARRVGLIRAGKCQPVM